jgi:hypothetical protein
MGTELFRTKERELRKTTVRWGHCMHAWNQDGEKLFTPSYTWKLVMQ